MPEDVLASLPKGTKVISDSETLKSLPKDVKIINAEVPKNKNPYFEDINKEKAVDSVDSFISELPDVLPGGETQKKILKDLALKGTPAAELKDAFLTMAGRHPYQESSTFGVNANYYYNDKGLPVPLKPNERPPKGYDVANDLHGTQEEANQKGFFASAGSHLYNGVLKGVLGIEGLANLPYALVTGEDADWYTAAKNRTEMSLYKTPEYETENQLFDAKDMKGIEDFFDSKRYNLDANTLQGAALNGLESITSFLVGTKGVGAVGKIAGSAAEGAGVIAQGGKTAEFLAGATKGGSLAQSFGGSYAITLPEVLDYMDENGITGDEKYRLASVIAIPVALTELIGGVEGQFAKNAAAKNAKSQVIRGLVDGAKRELDAKGKLSNEFLGEMFKATTSEATKLKNSFAKDLLQNIGEEAGTEGLQELEKRGLAEIYDHISGEDKFKKDPISFEAFGDYYNAALNGAAGAGGMSTVATIQKRKQEIQKRQSENVFNTVQKGPEAIDALIKNIGKSVDDGEITAEQGAEAYYRLDQYTKYNEQTKSLNLNEEDKRRVFDLTFEESSLKMQIPTDYEAEKLNGIEQGIIQGKKKQAKDLQDEITKIILKSQVENKTTPTAKKTQEDVAKDVKDIIKKGGVKAQELKENKTKYEQLQARVAKETRSYDEIPKAEFNDPKTDFAVIQAKMVEHISKQPNETAYATTKIDNKTFKEGNRTFNATLPDGKKIRYGSSMILDVEKTPEGNITGGHSSNTSEENFDNRENPVGQEVGMTVKTLKDSGRKVIFIWNANKNSPKYGKHLGMGKESKGGNSGYSEADIEEIKDLQTTNMAPKDGDGGTQTTTTPVNPKFPLAGADIGYSRPKVVLGQPTRESLRNKFIEDKINQVKESGNYDESIPKFYPKYYGERFDKLNPSLYTSKEEGTTAQEILDKVKRYNELNKSDKKSEGGVKLYNSIKNDAESINHTVAIANKGKLNLINEKGKKVYKTAVKRSSDVIQQEKFEKDQTKKAINMIPMSLDHMIIMDVANGERFNTKSLEDYGDNIGEVPSLFKQDDGGIDIRDYKQRMSEMMGLNSADDLPGTDIDFAKKVWETLGQYMFDGGRGAAIEDAKKIYERSINGGLTNKELEAQAEELGLTQKETAVITETVNNMSSEEVKESLTELNNTKDEIKTAKQIISEFGGEEISNNPFDEDFKEEERKPSDEIITRKPGDKDVFQKSKELEYAEGELVKAEKELSASKKAFDAKRKELDQGLMADQEDLFGERKSTDETSLFDERATVDARNDAVKPFKDRYDAAVKNYKKAQDKVASLEGSEDSQTSLFQKVAERKANVEKIVEKLKKSIPGIKVVFDENLKAAGKWSPSKKTITINPYYAGLDTPIHEYGHILIDAMGYNNKVIQSAIKQLKGTELWNKTKERYPELSEEDLGKEVLAEAIGSEGAGIFEKESEKSKFKAFLDYIFDWLKTRLGLNKNIAKSLAKQVLSGRGVVATEGKEQLQKTKETPEEKKARKAERKIQRAKEQEEVSEMLDGREIKDLPLNELVGLYEHIIGYSKSIQDKYFGDVKIQIAYTLFTQQKAKLEEWQKQGKVKGYNEEETNKSDIKKKDILMKSLAHMTQIVPELQAFNKMFESAYFDMTQERYELKNELEKFGKAVIKEKNKQLGILSKIKEYLFSSDNAKYFEFVENPKAYLGEDVDGDPIYGPGYWTLEEAREKKFSEAQMNFLKFMHKLQDERNEQFRNMGEAEMNGVLKVDKGVMEAFRTEGLMQAFSSFLGNGFNLKNVRIKYNGENMPYGEVEKDLLAKGSKGTIEKLVALKDMFKYNMAAKRQIQKGVHVDEGGENQLLLKGGAKFGINPHGALVNKFMKNRSKDRGYSKDFYKAAFDFIDEGTHSKHMSELLPYIDSIEYLNKMGLMDEEGNVLHGVKDNVAEWVKEWKDLHLFKADKVGKLGPEADVAMKILRTLTSQLVMAFNLKAGIINIAMGQYNNLRKETAEELGVGHVRMAKNPKKAADILRKYQVISVDYDSNPKLFAGKLFDMLAHGLTRAGEYYIQGSMFIGLMTDEQYNSFEYKKNKDGVDELVLKPGVDEQQFKDLMINNKTRISNIQGKYADKDRRNFMAGEFGKMVGQFKVWVPDWWKERFGEEYITADGEVRKGNYRSFTLDALKDLKKQFDEKGFKEAVWNNKTAMSNLKGALAVATLLAIKLGGDDDEKKRKQGDLLSQLTSNVLFVFDPSGLKFTVTNPVAAMGTVGKFIDIFESVSKGELDKAADRAVKVIPNNKLITQIPDLITGED